MPLTCNINRTGRILRLIYGILMLAAAAAVLIRCALRQQPLWWLLAGFLLLSGLFSLFEAWRGWCAMRAMGWKTPW